VVPDSSATRLSLISRIRVNDAQAWQELVDLYWPLVAFWCRKRGIADADVSDIVQDVFFAVCRALDGYQPDRKNGCFRSWLWTIARHKITDVLRRSHRVPDARGGSTAMLATNQIPQSETDELAGFELPMELDVNEASERSQYGLLAKRALRVVQDEFEPKTWEAFWRSTVDGIPVAVVAAELGLSTASIRKYRSRVLRRLREQLGELE